MRFSATGPGSCGPAKLVVANHLPPCSVLNWAISWCQIGAFSRAMATYPRPRQFQLAISAFNFFDRFTEWFKNWNITAIPVLLFCPKVRHFEPSRQGNGLVHQLRATRVDRDTC